MFALQQSIRSAALRAGKMALATACLAGPAIAVAQPATVRYPVTEEQRQTAGSPQVPGRSRHGRPATTADGDGIAGRSPLPQFIRGAW